MLVAALLFKRFSLTSHFIKYKLFQTLLPDVAAHIHMKNSVTNEERT